MASFQNKNRLIVAIVAIAILVIGGVFIAMAMNTSSDTATPSTPSKDTSVSQEDTSDATEEDTTAAESDPVTTQDPENLRSIDIEPLGITVFYTQGTPAFEYAILKTDSKTQYVQFTAAGLIGTKCTGDNGAFASIIKNPSSTEDQTTISQTVTVGDDTFGLSLSGAGCTADPELLSQYQAAFKDGFTSLKALP